jgi:hypothetical protein
MYHRYLCTDVRMVHLGTHYAHRHIGTPVHGYIIQEAPSWTFKIAITFKPIDLKFGKLNKFTYTHTPSLNNFTLHLPPGIAKEIVPIRYSRSIERISSCTFFFKSTTSLLLAYHLCACCIVHAML